MRLLVFAISLCLAAAALAQKTTRGKLRLRDDVRFQPTEKVNDTIVPPMGAIGLYGYEKTQQSATESFFVSNHTEREIESLVLTISYLNMRGELLHSRTEVIKCDIPPSETRKVDIKSWDRQKLWFYVGSHARHNDFSSPFDINFHIEYVVSPIL